jgi:hypothetical protein
MCSCVNAGMTTSIDELMHYPDSNKSLLHCEGLTTWKKIYCSARHGSLNLQVIALGSIHSCMPNQTLIHNPSPFLNDYRDIIGHLALFCVRILIRGHLGLS